jgi:hypothetical protein
MAFCPPSRTFDRINSSERMRFKRASPATPATLLSHNRQDWVFEGGHESKGSGSNGGIETVAPACSLPLGLVRQEVRGAAWSLNYSGKCEPAGKRALRPQESMPSNSTRIAYLKRMLKRLEGEESRINELVSAKELSPEGGDLAARLVRKSRGELLSELRNLEGGSAENSGTEGMS